MSGFMDNWLLRRAMSAPRGPKEYIQFADPAVEAICIANWSSDGIGLTYEDATAVTSFAQKFRANTNIVSFEEAQYFTGVSALREDFFMCTSLNRLVISSSVTSLYAYCLYNSALIEFVIPDSVTNIGSQCFSVSSIVRLVALPTSPPSVQASLGVMSNLQTIYVPYSSDHSVLDAYKAAFGWSTYASKIFELNPDGTIPS